MSNTTYASLLLLALTSTRGLTATAPVLSSPTPVGPQFQLTLTGQSNSPYIIEASTNFQTWWPIATNIQSAAVRQIQLPAFGDRSFYRAALGRPLFNFAIAAVDTIDLNGNNLLVDSFDSTNPYFSTLGQYDPLKRKAGGDVGTMAALSNSLNIGNATIIGRLLVAPRTTVFLGPNGKVGDLAWYANPTTAGIQPGFFRDDLALTLPTVAPPYISAFVPASGTRNGIYYKYILGSDNYQLSTLTLNSTEKMLVTGNAALYVTGNVLTSGSSHIEIASNAALRLYVAGPSAFFGGYGIVNSNAASAFIYYALPANTSISLSADTLNGCIYAPDATVTISAPTNTLSFTGSIAARRIAISGHAEIHYDESLRTTGPFTY